VSKIRWSIAPPDVIGQQRKNFLFVQIDAIGVGLASAAATFLPVFLTRLGATNSQIGLLTSMPAVTGLVMAILVGRFLQTRRNIVPWFSLARLLAISAYALTGLVVLLLPEAYQVGGILVIWAAVTLPQTVLVVSFSVVMNAVAGPRKRYDLMSRRWSILGAVTAITVAGAGIVLNKGNFPLNYQFVFMALSVGGLISFYFSRRIIIPEMEIPSQAKGGSLVDRFRDYTLLVRGESDFVRFSIQRFVFLSGTMLAIPLFPLYYVRVVEANDAWIGVINTAQSAVLLVGYFLWTRESRLRGSRFVLLWTTLGLALYPALVASTHSLALIVLFAGIAGVFQAGVDLVFFDELMKTVPVQYSATFVSLSQSMQYLSAIFAPLLGTWLATYIGIGGALLVSAGIRFLGFGLFALWKPKIALSLETPKQLPLPSPPDE
jgi:Major Facilitator Superfamily